MKLYFRIWTKLYCSNQIYPTCDLHEVHTWCGRCPNFVVITVSSLSATYATEQLRFVAKPVYHRDITSRVYCAIKFCTLCPCFAVRCQVIGASSWSETSKAVISAATYSCLIGFRSERTAKFFICFRASGVNPE